ncbi:YfjL-like protein [Romboutsia sp.]|uniref:YfjL-like protein n=1 Tax=Romboutsia sp. TaxID=1965302 RepID=UPI003F336DF6
MSSSQLVTSTIIAVVCIMGYNSFFGNPIGYIEAKNKINSYIDEKYNGELKIDNLAFNSKMNGYYATVSHVNDTRYSSYIGYCRTEYLNDGYKFDVRIKMEEEVKSIIESLIIQGTDLVRENIGVSPSIDIEEFKYRLDDNYTGVEPIDLEIWLHPYTSYREKDKNKNTQEVALHKNEEEFAKDAYDIIKILQSTNYNFSNIEIYSYKEDGNTSYRFKCKGNEKIKSQQEIETKVFIKESEKEKEIK